MITASDRRNCLTFSTRGFGSPAQYPNLTRTLMARSPSTATRDQWTGRTVPVPFAEEIWGIEDMYVLQAGAVITVVAIARPPMQISPKALVRPNLLFISTHNNYDLTANNNHILVEETTAKLRESAIPNTRACCFHRKNAVNGTAEFEGARVRRLRMAASRRLRRGSGRRGRALRPGGRLWATRLLPRGRSRRCRTRWPGRRCSSRGR